MSARAGIVWLASFPKSGNTWFRALLANLGSDEPVKLDDLASAPIASDRFLFESTTLLDSGLISDDDVDLLRPHIWEAIGASADGQIWVKAHDAWTMNAAGEPVLGRAAIAALYLVRDPRDVAISVAHHSDIELDEAITMLNDPDGAVARGGRRQPQQLRQTLLGWSTHAATWLDQSDVPMHLIRYEDLLADPAGGVAAALEFVGRSETPEAIERAVRHASFGVLQLQEAEHGFRERASRASPFFRSGKAGEWRTVLTAEQVARLEGAHGPMMRRLGYALEGEPEDSGGSGAFAGSASNARRTAN